VKSTQASGDSRPRAREPAEGRGVVMLLGNNPYPQDERVRREALTLVDNGYTVSVICPRAEAQPPRETVRGVHVHRYERRIRPRGTLGYLIEYLHAPLAALRVSLQVLVRHDFDVVHAHNPPDTLVLVGALYKLLLRKRFVFDHHDIAPEMYAARFGPAAKRLVFELLVLLERASCRLADRVIATNDSYRRLEVRRAGISSEKIAVVRNGPDVADLEPAAGDGRLRAKAATIIGYLGVMGYQDGVENLLYALRVLVHDLGRKDVLAVLVGDGDARADLCRLVNDLALEHHVWFAGYLDYDDWRRVLATADICVVPDPSNPYNDQSTIVKIMDYMALGKPIVAFDLPEHRVTAGQAATFVHANDVGKLAEAIAELIDDPARRAAMGTYGRRRAQTALCWPFSAAALVDCYEGMLAEPRSEGPKPAPWKVTSSRKRLRGAHPPSGLIAAGEGNAEHAPVS
jgi:glycosyltransferase involved in cell wall biosynthesis